MSEMVERVARVVIRKVGPSIDPAVAEMTVRIVLEAMREPTEEMINKGGTGVLNYNDHDALNGWYQSTLTCWRAMIDEALK